MERESRPEKWDYIGDILSRNLHMINIADVAVVVSPHNPIVLSGQAKGGTAHTVKHLKSKMDWVYWVSGPTFEEVWLNQFTQLSFE